MSIKTRSILRRGTSYDCQECRQRVSSAAEFHPYLYCLLYKLGVYNQEDYLRKNGFVRSVSDD